MDLRLISISFCHKVFIALMFIVSTSMRVHSSSNLIRNGSFEKFKGNGTLKGEYITDFDVETLTAPSAAVEEWWLTEGTLDWGKRRYPPSPDGTSCSIILNGTISTKFRMNHGFFMYTVLVDVAGHPTSTVESPVILSASVSSSTSNNDEKNSNKIDSESVLNVTVLRTTQSKYDGKYLHWHTLSMVFDGTGTNGFLTLSLSNPEHSPNTPIVDNVRVFAGFVQTPVYIYPERGPKGGHPAKKPYVLVPSIGIPIVAMLCLIATFCIRRRREFLQWREIQSLQERIQMYPYNVIKSATKNFHPKCKLGQGGFGPVYKGIMPDGSVVAVKQLAAASCQGQAEFLNEITLINRVQHRNLVTLKGCCIKGKQMLLVYEFLENRSLHQALLDQKMAIHIDWQTRIKIVIGTARGLVYMHEDSQERIVHRDIKASNILLDKNFNAKISDFGLAKIFDQDKTHVTTRVAGTLGYLAPEYALRGQLTEKADVFSYGILALEIVSGRVNTDTMLPVPQQFLLDWAFQLMGENRMLDVVDPRLGNQYVEEEAERLIFTAMWCTQVNPVARPSMSHVLTMILGESPIPPLPTRKTHSPRQHRELIALGVEPLSESDSWSASSV